MTERGPTDEQRRGILDTFLYDLSRYRHAVSRGALDPAHVSRMSGLSDAALDDVLAALEWGIEQKDIDYRRYALLLPDDRATIVRWLEIALRDLRGLRATRGST